MGKSTSPGACHLKKKTRSDIKEAVASPQPQRRPRAVTQLKRNLDCMKRRTKKIRHGITEATSNQLELTGSDEEGSEAETNGDLPMQYVNKSECLLSVRGLEWDSDNVSGKKTYASSDPTLPLAVTSCASQTKASASTHLPNTSSASPPLQRPLSSSLNNTGAPTMEWINHMMSETDECYKRISVRQEELHQKNMRLLDDTSKELEETTVAVANTLKAVSSSSQKMAEGMMLLVQDAQFAMQNISQIFSIVGEAINQIMQNQNLKNIVNLTGSIDATLESKNVVSRSTAENAFVSNQRNIDKDRITTNFERTCSVPNTSPSLNHKNIDQEEISQQNTKDREAVPQQSRKESSQISATELPSSLYCRLCATKIDKGIPIFTQTSDRASIAAKINTYLPIKVFNNGQFPEEICTDCEEELKRTVSFINRLNKGQQYFSHSENSSSTNGKVDLMTNAKDCSRKKKVLAEKSSLRQWDMCTNQHSDNLLKESEIKVENDVTNCIEVKEEEIELPDVSADCSQQLPVPVHADNLDGNVAESEICSTEPLTKDKRHASSRMTQQSDVCNKGSSKIRQVEKSQVTSTVSGQSLKVAKRKRVYQCQTCGIKFSNQGALRHHWCTALSDGVMPYKCYYCGTRYTQCSQLVEHVRTHAGLKIYSCEKCGEKFSNSIQLKCHMEEHTDQEQPTKKDSEHGEDSSIDKNKVTK